MGISWKTLHTIISILIIVLVIFFMLSSCEANKSLYNNGVCPSCDVEYTLQYVTRGGANHYECPECDKEFNVYYTIFDRFD